MTDHSKSDVSELVRVKPLGWRHDMAGWTFAAAFRGALRDEADGDV